MTAALAAAYLDVPDIQNSSAEHVLGGAQNLLTLKKARQNYLAEGVAVVVYALVLYGLLTYTTKPQEVPAEEPMELVMLPPPPPPPVEEPKPPEPEAVKPPEPLPVEPPPPPPPEAVEPAVAPVPPPPPPPPKVEQVVKPKPKPVVVVKPRPVAPPRPAPAAAVARPAPPPGATASAIANQIHARLARAAADAYPESQKPRSAHISYRVQIDASGHVTSFTITPSGNPAFDSVASRLGGRIGSVEAPGKPAALSGSFTFAYQ